MPTRRGSPFEQNFAPGTHVEPQEGAYPGSDQPAGPDSPWRPGFVAGFHAFLDQLDAYLSGELTRERAQPAIDAVYAGRSAATAWDEYPASRSPANDPTSHERLIDIYREHIRAHCPRT